MLTATPVSRHVSLALVVACLVLARASSCPANAQTSSEIKEALEALKARVAELERKLEKRQDPDENGTHSAGRGGTRPAENPSETSASRFQPFGRILADIGQVGDAGRIGIIEEGRFVPDPGLGSTVEMRSARLGARGAFGDWAYKFEVELADNAVSLTDVYLAYAGRENVSLKIGNHKTPVSLAEQTSSRFTKFMERGSFADAFGFARKLGVSLQTGGAVWHWRTGVFAEDALSGDDRASGFILASRGHYTIEAGKDFAHLGASLEYRDKGAQESRVRQRPFLHTTDTRFVDTGQLPARESLFAGAELAGVWGGFNAAGEYGVQIVDLEPVEDAVFQGGYLQLGYFLTGERRGYDPKTGVWTRTRPEAALGSGGFGAFQFSAGLDWLDLDAPGKEILGGTQTTITAGLTWIPVSRVRILANYSYVRAENSPTRIELGPNGTVAHEITVNAFGLRAQLDW